MGSMGDFGKYDKKTNVVCKSMFTVETKNWEGQELRRYIKVHRKLLIADFQFQKIKKVFISWRFLDYK